MNGRGFLFTIAACLVGLLCAGEGLAVQSVLVTRGGQINEVRLGMTKSELIEKVVQEHGMLNMKVSEMLVNTVFDSIEDALRSGDKVEIRGFGSFTIRERTGREARNPKSGEVVNIPAKKTPFFKTGKELKERVNC